MQQTPPQPLSVKKKSKKPLIATLVVLVVFIAAGIGSWFWWSNQQTLTDNKNATDQPANSSQQKLSEPNTVAYSYGTSDLQTPRDLFWRPASGGEKQNSSSKAYVDQSRIYGNQVIVSTYASPGAEMPTILYSKDGGKSYTTIFTGKKAASDSGLGDQITGIQFSSDGKSVIFALLPDNAKNTVKQISFDKPNEITDLMTSESRGVFLLGYNVKTKKLVFTEGCYNCDGNFSPTVYAYDTGVKQRTTLIDGKDKHLSVIANKSATKLLVTAPTVDKNKTTEDAFLGYYVGAPYTLNIFDLESTKSEDLATVGSEAENKFVRGGFMSDDVTPYYYVGNQLFMLGKNSPSLLYEAGKPVHEVFYASLETVYVSTGTYENFALNRFNIKAQKSTQLLTGDDVTTRIFGVTEN